MSPPQPRLVWTPGPTGQPVPPTVEELTAYLPRNGKGPNGLSLEHGVPAEDQMPVVACVYRAAHRPVGVLVIKLLEGTPEIVNIAVLENWRRRGIGRALCEAMLEHGIDLRDVGSVWDARLTAEGRALRDGLAGDRERYGFASWERPEAA